MGNTIIEILNPMSTAGNTTYDELSQTQNICGYCGINFSCRYNFSFTNPEYTSLTFLSYCPEFSPLITGDDPQYLSLFNTYYNMANITLNEQKFGLVTWQYLMSFFIAHYMTLTFQKIDAINTNVSQNNIAQTISALANQSIGLAVKESLGGEEIQIDNMINVGINKDAGLFMTTPYGQQFWNTYISYAKNFFRGVY